MKIVIAVTMTAVVLFTGCTTSSSGNVYSRREAQQVQTIEYGTVEAVREVMIEGEKSGKGTAIGGIAGGVLGSQVGSGRGSAVGGVVGAIAGGALGSKTEEKITESNALEIQVKLDGGQTIVVVQEADVFFNVGERVRVVQGAKTRIAKE